MWSSLKEMSESVDHLISSRTSKLRHLGLLGLNFSTASLGTVAAFVVGILVFWLSHRILKDWPCFISVTFPLLRGALEVPWSSRIHSLLKCCPGVEHIDTNTWYLISKSL
jgi:hypothetical protein